MSENPNRLIEVKDTFVGRMRLIQRITCEQFGVSIGEMISHRRQRHLLVPRHIAMMLCQKLTLASYPEIGRAFDRDHTTIISGVRRVRGYIQERPVLLNNITCISAKYTEFIKEKESAS